MRRLLTTIESLLLVWALFSVVTLTLFSGVAHAAAAPDFTVTDTDGHTITLSSLRGTTILIEFFTTSCSICKEEIPDLQTIRNSFSIQQLGMISLSHADDNPELTAYKNTYGISWPIAKCSWTNVYQAYNVPGVPTLILVDPNGQIAYKHSGNFDPQQVITKIAELTTTTPEPQPTPQPTPTEPQPTPTEPAPVDMEPPKISIISPANQTYSMKLCTVGNCTATVPLTFTVNEPTSWIGYRLDNQQNFQTITQNSTITNLLDGPHTLLIYAKDAKGNQGCSNIIQFTIDTTPPLIERITKTVNNNATEMEMQISVRAIDSLSDVKQVSLNYTDCDQQPTLINMTNLEQDIWSADVTFLHQCENTSYTLILEDTVGNTRTTQNFNVIDAEAIPEFPAQLIIPIFIATTILLFHTKQKLTTKKTAKHKNKKNT
jgi:peroxiredoxin